jgi:hypothetical protein
MMNDSLNAGPFNCSAHIHSQVSLGHWGTRARGNAPRNPCFTMPIEFSASPLARPQKARVRADLIRCRESGKVQ